jgi:hypothetical protein
MVPSLLQLLRRDHDELERGLRALVRPRPGELRETLDGVRLGLLAHMEAEDIVVDPSLIPGDAEIMRVIAARRADHLEQERAFGALMRCHPGTSLWRDRTLHLVAMVRRHRDSSEAALQIALDAAESTRVAKLAGAYATTRMRQLAMLMPSGPIVMPEELQELALATA